ncbi:glycosyltransferase [Geobacter sp. AOG1]|uniref:glycosyltransferase n=1 Tax=Geobacter sp. AOG1 TaxID=1566346 RepID=UPI001CC5ED5F|nr:glycosyltransferase [Geobacter sp. AOG1]GFE58134.1 hypothetical protein AOG1_20140 [Geobacter sp. AOG1]
MANNITLSVVLPSYLEEENLRLILPRLHDVLEKLTDAYEILVVDTMTPLDNTVDVCLQNSVRYINREGGNSFGDAVRTGIAQARGKYLLFMDADGSHPPEFIPNLYRHVGDHDVVIASRYVKGGYTENPWVLVYMSRVLNLIYSVVLNLKCKDVSNSFKIYRGELLRPLKLYCDNFDIVEELLYKLSKQNKGISIREVPFSFKKRMFGKTKRSLFVFIVSYLFTLLKLRFGK